MAYFSSFLLCHLYFRHRFPSTGYPNVDRAWRFLVYTLLLAWTSLVAYSRYLLITLPCALSLTQSPLLRYYLGYHNVNQISWGLGIGAALGVPLYLLSTAIPAWYPLSALGRLKRAILAHPITTWLEVRDGWAIWADGGREEEWRRWRREWEKQQVLSTKKHK